MSEERKKMTDLSINKNSSCTEILKAMIILKTNEKLMD